MGRPISKRKADTRERALGAVITELRLKKELTAQDVAEKVGCNDGHMNEIETGKQNPTFKVLQAIADFHGIKLSKLFAMAEKKYDLGRHPLRP
jgi:transcriptional regulator with XRE-family HTH domain